eukprot:353594-Chlamydomonas_euryale.AAC.3
MRTHLRACMNASMQCEQAFPGAHVSCMHACGSDPFMFAVHMHLHVRRRNEQGSRSCSATTAVAQLDGCALTPATHPPCPQQNMG